MAKFKVGDIIVYPNIFGNRYYLIVDECYEAYERMALTKGAPEGTLFKCHEKGYRLAA